MLDEENVLPSGEAPTRFLEGQRAGVDAAVSESALELGAREEEPGEAPVSATEVENGGVSAQERREMTEELTPSGPASFT